MVNQWKEVQCWEKCTVPTKLLDKIGPWTGRTLVRLSQLVFKGPDFLRYPPAPSDRKGERVRKDILLTRVQRQAQKTRARRGKGKKKEQAARAASRKQAAKAKI